MTQTVIPMHDIPMHEAWTHDHWTEQQLAELPQDGKRYEIIDGRLYVTSPAGEPHQRFGTGLIATLENAAPDGWRVLYEIGLRIGEPVTVKTKTPRSA